MKASKRIILSLLFCATLGLTSCGVMVDSGESNNASSSNESGEPSSSEEESVFSPSIFKAKVNNTQAINNAVLTTTITKGLDEQTIVFTLNDSLIRFNPVYSPSTYKYFYFGDFEVLDNDHLDYDNRFESVFFYSTLDEDGDEEVEYYRWMFDDSINNISGILKNVTGISAATINDDDISLVDDKVVINNISATFDMDYNVLSDFYWPHNPPLNDVVKVVVNEYDEYITDFTIHIHEINEEHIAFTDDEVIINCKISNVGTATKIVDPRNSAIQRRKLKVTCESDAEKAVIKSLINTYNSTAQESDKIYAKITVDATNNTTDYMIRYDDYGKGINAPDIFFSHDAYIKKLVDMNKIADIGSGYSDSLISNNTEDSMVSISFDEHVYGFPISLSSGYFLYYNSDYIDDSDVLSLESLIAKITSINKKFYFPIGTESIYYASMLFNGAAGGIVSWDYDINHNAIYTINWDNEELSERAENFNAFYRGNNGSIIGSDSTNYFTSSFLSEESVAGIFGSWGYDGLKTQLGDKIKAVKLPTFEGVQLGSFDDYTYYVINDCKTVDDSPQRKEKSKILANLLTSEEAQLLRAASMYNVPTNLNVLGSAEYLDNEAIVSKALREQQSTSSLNQRFVETRFWSHGFQIAELLTTNNIHYYGNMRERLTSFCDELRNPDPYSL